MDEDRTQRKNLIDRANDAYSSYQNARSLARLGKGAFSAARGVAGAARGVGALAATAEIWGPIAIVLIIILVPTFLIVMGGQGAASETPEGVELEISECTDLNTDPAACLMRDFKIQTVGFPTQYAIEVYNAFALSYNQSPLYQELWNTGGHTLTLTYNSQESTYGDQTTCHGQAFSATSMAMWNMDKCSYSTGNAYLIIHEIAHVISFRNDRLFNSFNYKDLANKDPDCYRSYLGGMPYLKTYIGPGVHPKDENFAEALTDYVIYKSWGRSRGLADFPSQCPATYGWAHDNVFGTDIVTAGGL